MAAAIEEHDAQLDELPVHWRRAAGPQPATLWLHGVPSSSRDWEPFLAAHGGIAPDLPGFGRSGKPGHFPYAIDGYADWLERFLALAGLDEIDLVVHDWGAVGLAWAQRRPERVRRLVVIDAVPLLPGYDWHRRARVWRRRGLGELAMGFATRRGLGRALREANVRPLPDAALDAIWRDFDQGTQRAILRLYRSADPAALARAGAGLGRLGGPALVLWGAEDPYLPPVWAERYGAALGGAAVEVVPGAGHWPWLDRPELVERVAGFLRGR
jgi:pimeloyl-ACP methyl ester carboxylesterase